MEVKKSLNEELKNLHAKANGEKTLSSSEIKNLQKLKICETLGDDVWSSQEDAKYLRMSKEIKDEIDSLFENGDYEVIHTLYRLLIKRGPQEPTLVSKQTKAINEDHNPVIGQKVEEIKAGLEKMFNADQYDAIEKIYNIFNRLFNNKDSEISTIGLNERESTQSETYFDTQTEAFEHALEKAKQKGFEIKEEDLQNSVFTQGWVGTENYRKDSIPLYKDGKLQRKMLQIVLYRMPSGKYELTTYIN